MDESEKLAKQFHETYERLAPSFGYETRKDSAVPWEAVPEKNRKLMVAVCGEIAAQAQASLAAARAQALEPLREIMDLIEKGALVRDTSHDHEPHWAMRQIPLVNALKKAQESLGSVPSDSTALAKLLAARVAELKGEQPKP